MIEFEQIFSNKRTYGGHVESPFFFVGLEFALLGCGCGGGQVVLVVEWECGSGYGEEMHHQ